MIVPHVSELKTYVGVSLLVGLAIGVTSVMFARAYTEETGEIIVRNVVNTSTDMTFL